MKWAKCLILTVFLQILMTTVISGQSPVLALKGGSYIPPPNSLTGLQDLRRSQSSFSKDFDFIFLQFETIPGESEKGEIESLGIEVLNYIPSNTYLAAIPKNLLASRLTGLHIRSSFRLPSEYRISESIARSKNRDEVIEMRIQFAKKITPEEMLSELSSRGIQVIEQRLLNFGIVDVKIESGKFEELLAHPGIIYCDQIPTDELLRHKAINLERTGKLTSEAYRNLHGEGMVIGIGDGGKIGDHQDFNSRVNEFSSFGLSSHATHVTGIIAGYPNINPDKGSGIASRAEVVVNNYSDIIIRTPDYINDYGIVLTNNSYGANLGNCTLMGDYNSTSALLDDQLNFYPFLAHVFASGNDGGKTCSPLPARYGTVLGGYQSAKNVFTIGSSNGDDLLSPFSSRGPTDDGRIKPEIVAMGSNIHSTGFNNTYSSGSGTSYSAPAITGITALMYQRYRQLFAGVDPEATLIKALLCNTAEDLGNEGPDYEWGFGRVHTERAMLAMENGQYMTGTLGQSEIQSHMISVPAGVFQVKIMLAWKDPSAAPFVTRTLVNDLDLQVLNPNDAIFNPWILNPTPGGIMNNATRGKDHYNNYEQVTIDNPESGTFSINLSGFEVPIGTQDYVLVYDFVMPGIDLTYPLEGAQFVPLTAEKIYWDVEGAVNNLHLEYSLDNGTSWTTIDSTLEPTSRQLVWITPDTFSTEVKIRISEFGSPFSSENEGTLVLMPRPDNVTATSYCSQHIQLNWNAHEYADSFAIYKLLDGEMQKIATTSDTNFVQGDLINGTTYWYSVSAIIADTIESRRTIAVSASPSLAICPWPNDIFLSTLVEPIDARENTSNALTFFERVKIKLHNLDTIGHGNIPLSYQINGGLISTETLTDTIAGGDSLIYQFATPTDLLSSGDYTVKVWCAYSGDTINFNDTLVQVVRHIANSPATLPVTIDFELPQKIDLVTGTFGISGMEYADFTTMGNGGRIRTFAGSGFIHSGAGALTLDASKYQQEAFNEVIFTINMTSYDTSSNDIRLILAFMHHELDLDNDSLDLLWIRGDDQSPWIEVYDFFERSGLKGKYVEETEGVLVTNFLRDNSQNYSSSFQIKVGQQGDSSADEPTSQDGMTIDDIVLYEVSSDVQLRRLSNPVPAGCGLEIEQIALEIKNTSSTATSGLTAHYKVNGGAEFSESVPPIDGLSTSVFQFTTSYDFSSMGTYFIDAWIEAPGDTYNGNDSLNNVKIVRYPSISEFPYLETFESGSSGWATSGNNSSWQYGHPGGNIINDAAEGDFAWVTNLNGNHNTSEESYLVSPCFDLSGLVQPMLSFAYIHHLENGFDYSWVEYTDDGGVSWSKLGNEGEGTNWYNDAAENAWDNFHTYWHVASIDVPTNSTAVQFRFVLNSDSGFEFEGVGIDNVHMFDKKTIYNGPNLNLNETLGAFDWEHVDVLGERLMSINTDGQYLGETVVNFFKDTTQIRYTENAYLMHRNFVIQPTHLIAYPVGIRIYFTDEEAEEMRFAFGCNDCIVPSDAFDYGAITYDGPDEDGDISNNNGTTNFLKRDSVHIVPFNEGYYAEYWVTSFSEFWVTSNPMLFGDTLCVNISASADDAEEHGVSGSVNPVDTVLQMVEDDGSQHLGFRFQDIEIPNGSFIEEAYLQFTAKDVQSDTTQIKIYSEYNLNSPIEFTTGSYNISQRTKSVDSVMWNVDAWNSIDESGIAQRSPELRKLVQQAVDIPAWNIGNHLAFLIQGEGLRTAYSYEADIQKSAKLFIVFDSICGLDHRIYVNPGAVGRQTGKSWQDAFTDLQDALELARNCPDISEMWIKEGTYEPSHNGDRSVSFEIPQGLQVFGGFVGSEDSLSQRDYAQNPTILSGDIGVVNDSTDNTFHVVSVTIPPGVELEPATLDGVSIANGQADGIESNENRGAGAYVTSVLHLRNVIMEDQVATADGSFIYLHTNVAKVILENCMIQKSVEDTLIPILAEDNASLLIKGVTTVEIIND